MIKKRVIHTSTKVSGSARVWKNALVNEPAFILGNGPSISDHPIKKLKEYFTIGINKAYKLLDTSILMWQDIEFWYSDREFIAKTQSIKYCKNTADPYSKFIRFKIMPGDFKIPANPAYLHGFGTTGALAFQLAHSLGCNPIILLGMDCKYFDGKTDFYGKNHHHKPHTLKNCTKGLRWISSNTDRTIINCSLNKVFLEKNKLDDVLDSFKDKYLPKGRDHYYNQLMQHFN